MCCLNHFRFVSHAKDSGLGNKSANILRNAEVARGRHDGNISAGRRFAEGTVGRQTDDPLGGHQVLRRLGAERFLAVWGERTNST